MKTGNYHDALPSGGGTTWGYALNTHGEHVTPVTYLGQTPDTRHVYRVAAVISTSVFALQAANITSSGTIRNDYTNEWVMYAGTPTGTNKMKVVKLPTSGTADWDMTINFTAGQLDYVYTTASNKIVEFVPRMMSDDFKHIWILFSDMRNNGEDDADGETKETDFGIVYPIADNYAFTLVSTHNLSESDESDE